MRFSSSFKVGILTLIALFILLFTILWIKGRSFSSGERIEVVFKDVNGMRPGSGVQMMGLRIGQVEEIVPVINGDDSFVKLRFVITEPDITIPKASVFSIQQSGLIGEQFLEITPPKLRTTYIPVTKEVNLLYKNDPVQIKLDKSFYDVGRIKDVQIMSSLLVPPLMRERINTKYSYKIDYVVNLPGLVLPDYMLGKIIDESGIKKLRISMLDSSILPYPKQTSLYTVVEPMRISDFLELQYSAAESLTETTLKINELLSNDVIADLKQSVANIDMLTSKSITTVDKANKLIDSSQKDLDSLVDMANSVSTNFGAITNVVTGLFGDQKLKDSIISTSDSVDKLAKNLNKVMDNVDSKQLASDLQSTVKNLSDITAFISSTTKDKKLKQQLNDTIENINKATKDVSSALEVVNSMTPAQKCQVQSMISDAAATTHNLKKFSEKLNKRFLLFRLMF